MTQVNGLTATQTCPNLGRASYLRSEKKCKQTAERCQLTLIIVLRPRFRPFEKKNLFFPEKCSSSNPSLAGFLKLTTQLRWRLPCCAGKPWILTCNYIGVRREMAKFSPAISSSNTDVKQVFNFNAYCWCSLYSWCDVIFDRFGLTTPSLLQLS